MPNLRLAATHRTVLGKKTKRLRQHGKIPGALYGHGIDTQPIEVDAVALDRVYRQAGTSSLIALDVDGLETQVLIRDMSVDPLHRRPLHVEFFQVRMTETLTSDVPILLEGESPAVRDQNGVLLALLTHVQVRSLPGNLPHALHVDLTRLDHLDQSITLADLVVPEGVEILASDLAEAVVRVMPPRGGEAEEEAAAAPEEEQEAPASEEAGG